MAINSSVALGTSANPFTVKEHYHLNETEKGTKLQINSEDVEGVLVALTKNSNTKIYFTMMLPKYNWSLSHDNYNDTKLFYAELKTPDEKVKEFVKGETLPYGSKVDLQEVGFLTAVKTNPLEASLGHQFTELVYEFIEPKKTGIESVPKKPVLQTQGSMVVVDLAV
ncbi:hypothetical protein SOPP22_06650 [Shewanella sp. OPT22]|nr:hypothetical protein SOPP22_06650 [Shewanella sp. OPT22]